MKNLIIGTAGHVDHGKTSLIKALTGIDADRLSEEKKRGITIDIGFAYIDLNENQRVGIVDVPGHERFIRNMLLGAGGVDIALLVVAADEGVMPQTREHLDILSLLNIKKGVVAVTKRDMVDAEWLELMMEDLKDSLKNTFLRDAKILPVSSKTGEGIDELRNEISRLVEETEEKDTNRDFRLPVDRVFTKQGFGTVITGTLIEGVLNEGDDLIVYPRGIESKVRSIQVHSRDVKTAYAGQRVAVNLLKLKQEELEKGAVLAKPGSLTQTTLIDVKLTLLDSSKREVLNDSRLHFYHGASEEIARVILLDDKKRILPGESAFAQLILSEPAAVKVGDPFVVRFYSPLETIGGGVILDPNPKKHKKGSKDAVKKLELMSSFDEKNLVEGLLMENSRFAVTKKLIIGKTSLSEESVSSALKELIAEKKAYVLLDEIYVHADFVNEMSKRFLNELALFHEREPLKEGMKQEELIKKRLDSFTSAQKEALLLLLVDMKLLKKTQGFYARADFELKLSENQLCLKQKILEKLMSEGFMPSERPKIIEHFAKEKNVDSLLSYMIDKGELVMLSYDCLLPREGLEEAKQAFLELLKQNANGVSLADFRDKIESSRKYALLILEYFDKTGFTKKQDDLRLIV